MVGWSRPAGITEIVLRYDLISEGLEEPGAPVGDRTFPHRSPVSWALSGKKRTVNAEAAEERRA